MPFFAKEDVDERRSVAIFRVMTKCPEINCHTWHILLCILVFLCFIRLHHMQGQRLYITDIQSNFL